MPVTNVDAAGILPAINRLMWRWADRFVLAHDLGQLETALPGADDALRRESVRAEVDTRAVTMWARGDVAMIVAALSWRHWTSCRLEFGSQPVAAEAPDRLRQAVRAWPRTGLAPASSDAIARARRAPRGEPAATERS
jgi:hypothetical protein